MNLKDLENHSEYIIHLCIFSEVFVQMFIHILFLNSLFILDSSYMLDLVPTPYIYLQIFSWLVVCLFIHSLGMIFKKQKFFGWCQSFFFFINSCCVLYKILYLFKPIPSHQIFRLSFRSIIGLNFTFMFITY